MIKKWIIIFFVFLGFSSFLKAEQSLLSPFPYITDVSGSTNTFATDLIFPDGSLTTDGSVATLTFGGSSLGPGSSNYIQNTSALQSGATFYVSSGTVDGQFCVTSGNVGIGTASPSEKLSVVGN